MRTKEEGEIKRTHPERMRPCILHLWQRLLEELSAYEDAEACADNCNDKACDQVVCGKAKKTEDKSSNKTTAYAKKNVLEHS